jgi:hypothetical protein
MSRKRRRDQAPSARYPEHRAWRWTRRRCGRLSGNSQTDARQSWAMPASPDSHAGRRRLRHRAVQPGGAGRPHPHRPAPDRQLGGAVQPARLRGPPARRRDARGRAWRRADRADRDRVPAAALPAHQSAARAHARADPQPCLGLRLRRRCARARDLCELPAQEARRARAPCSARCAGSRRRPRAWACWSRTC